MDNPNVFIVILNWNGYRDTAECLRSLGKITYPACKIVLVDNGSTDGSVSKLKEEFGEVVYIENRENLGFAVGNNVGISYALEKGADYVLLLNNDTLVAPDFLTRMVAATESDRGIGIAGPMIYEGLPESRILWGAGGEIDWTHGRTWHAGYHEVDRGQWEGVRDVDYVSGCAFLVKRKALEEVGLLDERYFLYYEETDFCVRARGRGGRVVCVADARVWHKASASAGGEQGPVYTYYMTRNRLLFMRNHSDASVWRRFVLYFYYEGLLRRAVVLLCKSRKRGKSLRALWSGWRDFREGRFYQGPAWLHEI